MHITFDLINVYYKRKFVDKTLKSYMSYLRNLIDSQVLLDRKISPPSYDASKRLNLEVCNLNFIHDHILKIEYGKDKAKICPE